MLRQDTLTFYVNKKQYLPYTPVNGRVTYSEALGDGEVFGVGFGEGDLALPDFVASVPLGLAEAVADGLGSSEGEGATDGAMTTSGEGVGSGCEVTLSLNHTK